MPRRPPPPRPPRRTSKEKDESSEGPYAAATASAASLNNGDTPHSADSSVTRQSESSSVTREEDLSFATPKSAATVSSTSSEAAAAPKAHGMYPKTTLADDPAERDIYGFRIDGKIPVPEYKAWLAKHEKALVKKRAKWQELFQKCQGLTWTESKKLKDLVRGGIVDSLRGQVWMEVCGAGKKMRDCPGLYRQLVQEEGAGGSEEALAQIELDLHRTFPEHVHFAGGRGKPDGTMVGALRRVLRAYARRNKKVGYCQGMNFIAGIMLLFLQEDQVFWLLTVLLEEILPADYYAKDLSGCNVDLRCFRELLSRKLPKLWKHFQQAGVDVEFFCLEWFIAIFAKTLPTETLLRVWDSVFLEGYKIIFRIALAVLQMNEKELMAISEPHELFQAVQKLGRNTLDADKLMTTSFGFQLKRVQVEQLREIHRQAVDAEVQARQRKDEQ